MLFLDFKTYSECDLVRDGLHKYADDLSTEILCVSWAYSWGDSDSDVKLWIVGEDIPHAAIPDDIDGFTGLTVPADLLYQLTDTQDIAAYNAEFERLLMKGPYAEYLGFPTVADKRWHCLMASADVAGLPHGRDRAASVLIGSGREANDYGGDGNIAMLSKPMTHPTMDFERYTVKTHPDRYKNLYMHSVMDVTMERDLYFGGVWHLCDRDREEFRLTQKINDRGIRINTEGAKAALKAAKTLRHEADVRLKDITGGIAATSIEALRKWASEQGKIKIPDMRRPTVRTVINQLKTMRPVLHAEARYGVDLALEALEAHASMSNMLMARIQALIDHAGAGSRARGLLGYRGHKTGGWVAPLLQGLRKERPDEPVEGIGTLLTASPGKRLCWARYEGMALRLLAWAAGDENRLAAHRANCDVHANLGHRMNADMAFKDQVAWAEMMDEAFIYQQGGGRLIQIASARGLSLDAKESYHMYKLWLRHNREIVKWWRDVENAARGAVRNPGQQYPVTGGPTFLFKDRWLSLKMPNGAQLFYIDPEVGVEADGRISHMGMNAQGRYCRVDKRGGDFVRDFCNASAHQLVVSAALEIEREQPIVAITGDGDIITESEDPDLKWMIETMESVTLWSHDVPLRIRGWSGDRYLD